MPSGGVATNSLRNSVTKYCFGCSTGELYRDCMGEREGGRERERARERGKWEIQRDMDRGVGIVVMERNRGGKEKMPLRDVPLRTRLYGAPG